MVKFSSLLDLMNMISLSTCVIPVSTSDLAARSYRFLKKHGPAYVTFRRTMMAADLTVTFFWMSYFAYNLIQHRKRSVVAWVQLSWWSVLHLNAYATLGVNRRRRELIYESTKMLIEIDTRLGLYDGGWFDGTAISLLLSSSLVVIGAVVVFWNLFMFAPNEADTIHMYYYAVVVYHLLVSLTGEMQFRMLVLFIARASRRIREGIVVVLGPETPAGPRARRRACSSGPTRYKSPSERSSGFPWETPGQTPSASEGSCRFHDLMEMQLLAFRCKKNLEKAFGWQILLKAVYDLFNTTFVLYGVAVMVMTGDLTEFSVYVGVARFSLWYVFVTARGMAEKISACEELYKEVRKVKLLVTSKKLSPFSVF